MKYLKESIEILSKIINRSFRFLLADLHSDAKWVVDYLLKDYDIKPVIVGGLAVQYHGYRRMTEDIDILISKADYDRLVEDGKIKFGQLKIKPGIQIDVISEGKDNNPSPEFIRDEDTYWPTLEGLIYHKLLFRRMKDKADIVELLKANEMTEDLYNRTINLLSNEMIPSFEELWLRAEEELKNTEEPMRDRE